MPHARRHLARSLTLLVASLLVASCTSSAVPPTPVPSAESPSASPSAADASPSTGPSPSPSPVTSPSPSPVPSPSPTPLPTIAPTPFPSLSATACARAAFARLSEPERIGQLFLIALTGSSLSDQDIGVIRADHLGNVWISFDRTSGTAGIRSLTDAVQALAPAATAGIRFLVGADQEGGLVQRLAGPGFSTIPSALVQGGYAPPVLKADATIWGRQLAAAGVDLDLAPVMDVVPPGTDAQNPPIGALQREYGHDPASVAAHADAVIAGMWEAGVATVIKHFPGLGRVTANTDLAAGVTDTVTTIDDPYLASFSAGIKAGVRFVMVSLATYERIDPDHLAAFSPTVMRTLLRDRSGFTGVIVSDSLTVTAVQAVPPGTRAMGFLEAGGDLMIVNGDDDADAMAVAVAQRAGADPAFRALVDASALRILEAKAALGLVPCS
jgi:beta-N-acetylhexosaminidase